MSYPSHLFRVVFTNEGPVYCPLFFVEKDVFGSIPASLVCDAADKPICIEASLSPVLRQKLEEFNLLTLIGLSPTIQYRRAATDVFIALKTYESWKELEYEVDYIVKDVHDCVKIEFKDPLPELSAFIDLACVDIVILFNLLGLVTIDSCENQDSLLCLQVAKKVSDALSLQWLRRYCATYIREDDHLIFLAYPPARVAALVQTLMTYWDYHKRYYNKRWVPQ